MSGREIMWIILIFGAGLLWGCICATAIFPFSLLGGFVIEITGAFYIAIGLHRLKRMTEENQE